jgi:hypothetical protein
LDLEDFHSGEQALADPSSLGDRLAARIERAVLPNAVFVTAAGTSVARAYEKKYRIQAIPINNTFPLPRKPPRFTPSPGEGLRLYWFSQTIGPGRGLEDPIMAMGLAGISGELHLRGRAMSGYLATLRRLADGAASRLKIIHHEPAPPDSLVDLCSGFDVGLAVEPGISVNNRLALSNKAFTYLLAGLAVVFTNTPGQRALAQDVGEGAILYTPGDVVTLAAGLKRWAEDKPQLFRSKSAAWQAAERRWHWEHPEERGALLRAVGGVFG